MTLKDFLTRHQWGEFSLFKDLRSAAQFILDNSDSGFKSATSLASLLGQVSSCERGFSDRLVKSIQSALVVASESWPKDIRDQVARDFDEVLRTNKLVTSSKNRKTKSTDLMSSVEQDFADAKTLFFVMNEHFYLYHRIFGKPLTGIFERLVNPDVGSKPGTSRPQVTILVPHGLGYLMGKIMSDALVKMAPNQEDRLRKLTEESTLSIFEVNPTACWSTGVVAVLEEGLVVGFHLYLTDVMRETRISPMSFEVASSARLNLYHRLWDVDDELLQKKEVPIIWPKS